MGPVEGVDGEGVAGQVGDEAEVHPGGEQLLVAIEGPGAAHDGPSAQVDALGDLGHADRVVGDGPPALLVQPLDQSHQGLHHPHPHRVVDLQALEVADGGGGPEARVEAHRDLTGGPGPAQPGDELLDEALGAALGVGRALAHPGVEHLAGVGPGGEQGVVTEHLGVAVGGTGLLLAGHLADGGVEIDHQPVG